jgi:hypothetical protein
MCLYLYNRELRDGATCKELLKISNYRPLGLQGVEVSRISRHYNVMVVWSELGTGHHYTQEIFLVLVSVRDLVNLIAIMQPEGLSQ